MSRSGEGPDGGGVVIDMSAWRGFFISFEGLDGAGKSTQVASLAGALRQQGHDVVTVRPNETPLGEILHSFVLQHQRGPALEAWAEALLFTAERVQLLHEVVLPALRRGSVVIADRYADSTIAYQGGGRGIPPGDLLRLHAAACGDVWPDLTLYLAIPAATAAQRQRAQQLPLDRFEVAPETFHAAVEAAFDQLAAQHPRRFVRVDATRTAIAVSRDVEKVIVQRLPAPAPASPPARTPGGFEPSPYGGAPVG
jgi:dTMP kinase